jgi:nucleotide-binding universal stress UspA family protein
MSEEVVVGVDGSQNSLAALRWAGAYAARTGAVIRAINAWELPMVADITGMVPVPDQRIMVDAANAILDEAIREADLAPGVTVIREVIAGSAETLLEEAKGASLMVVGRRGHSGVIGLLTGSVATYCANHATIPVVIVPTP